ncbi:MAG TPA: tetratricopeptide repeat protein [Pyrinomonadaceae bacterium]|nr:tetratricopeptide repeat protein [Pyrinomonadaceae bacterium]
MNKAALILCLLFSLVPSQSRFAIFGQVRDANGNGVGSIRVSLLNENEQTLRTVFADNTGRYKFPNLGEGIYLVRVEPAGTPFEELTHRIELQSLSPLSSSTEDPWMVDFRLKVRKEEGRSGVPGVIFVQPVPPAAVEQFNKAVSSLNDKKTESAIQFFQKAIELYPDYFLALEMLGTEYVKGGKYVEAVPVLSRATELNPNASKSFYALGVAHLKTDRSAEAVNWLQRAADKDAKSANTFMMLGLAHGNLGAYGESETAFKKAYLLGKSDVAEVHFYLAGIYNKQQRYADAVRELELFLKESKDIRDRDQIKGLIVKLKEKAKTPK